MNRLSEDVKSAALDLKRDARPLGLYLLATEVHVYAFAIAANVLLAFYPFMLVMISLCRHVFHWTQAEKAIYVAIKDYFPGTTGEFLAYNLGVSASYTRQLEWVSVLLLLFTANGVFLPLEVALNRAWGATSNRSLWKNQLVSMGLIFACGALALLSAAFTAANLELLAGVEVTHATIFTWVARLIFKAASVPITIIILILVYCYLPNVKVPKAAVIPRAIVIGLVLEVLKWVNLAAWPWMYRKFSREYGVFVNSVTILTWSFLAGLIVLAGAEWTARRARAATAAAVTPGATATPEPR